MSEATLQSNVIRYIRMNYPNLRYCASLGGQYQKYISQRLKAKNTGYVKGFPDIFIYEARGVYHGMALEIKTKTGRATTEQKQWINDLNSNGYYATIKKGWDNIIEAIDYYMKLPKHIPYEKSKQEATKDK